VRPVRTNPPAIGRNTGLACPGLAYAGLAVGIALLALPATALAQPAMEATTPPPTGSVVQDTGLRQQLQTYFDRTEPPEPNTNQPAWTFVPSINIEEDWTNNAQQVSGGQSSFYTTVRPGLLVNGDTPRVKATLNWDPEVRVYTPESGENQFDNNITGDALVTVVPETFFIDMRVYGAVQDEQPGSAPNSVTNSSRQNTVQTYTGSIAPYLQHRFGDWGVGEVGGSVSRTTQVFLGNQSTASTNGFGDNEDLTSTQEHAVFTLGNAFGRSSGQVLTQGQQDNGTGALQGAYQYQAGVQYGYGITRQVTGLVELGWEDIHYSGVAPLNVNDATWSVGGRWTPSPDSSMTVTYGHIDGANSFAGNASLTVGTRGRLYGSYGQGITSNTQYLQNTFTQSQLDPYGNPVNPQTGAPLLVGGNFGGLLGNGTIFRQTNFSIGYSILFDRDTFSIGATYQHQLGLTGETTAAVGALDTTTNGTLTWQHQLTPDLMLTSYVQYGRSSSSFPAGSTVNGGTATPAISNSSKPFAASVNLSRQITETLSVYGRYTYTSGQQRFNDGQNLNGLQTTAGVNTIGIGLLKTFR
jgi:uncharacterized protein (PEP-CTERM system associated)